MLELKMSNEPLVWAIIGGAGAGKSTKAREVYTTMGFQYIVSLDDLFIKDSEFRKNLLKIKEEHSWDEYRDACNQMNWWDWGRLEDILRDKEGSRILLEGAILGPPNIWKYIDRLFYIQVPSATRLRNLCERDGYKRNGLDLAHRFMITEYSEYVHYMMVLPHFQNKNKLSVVDGDFNPLPNYELEHTHKYLPKRISI
jgi:uridine kinase